MVDSKVGRGQGQKVCRRLRAARCQPTKARSGGIVSIMVEGVHIAHRARKCAGDARIQRKNCGKALVRMAVSSLLDPAITMTRRA